MTTAYHDWGFLKCVQTNVCQQWSLKFTITEVFNQGIVSALTECKQKKTKQINFQPDGSSLASSLFSHEHHRPKTPQTQNSVHILRMARPGKLVPWVTT